MKALSINACQQNKRITQQQQEQTRSITEQELHIEAPEYTDTILVTDQAL